MKKLLLAVAGAALLPCSVAVSQATDKHLVYIHGCCIDKVGGGAYETIVKDLQQAGFNVTFELRRDDSNAAVQAYAAKVTDQVKELLNKGVAPEDITVAGYSLGSRTAMLVSIAIANPKVNYVLLAGCPRPSGRKIDIDYARVQGRVLSIVDSKDDKFESCKEHLPATALQQEITFDSGSGHQIFRFTTDKAYKLWKEPLEAWARGQ
jgi:hypothetical protein